MSVIDILNEKVGEKVNDIINFSADDYVSLTIDEDEYISSDEIDEEDNSIVYVDNNNNVGYSLLEYITYENYNNYYFSCNYFVNESENY